MSDQQTPREFVITTLIVVGVLTTLTIASIILHDTSQLKPPVQQCQWDAASEANDSDQAGVQADWPQFGKFQFDEFYVTAVENGKSLRVWSRKPFNGKQFGPTEDALRLAGIWSEPATEPANVYAGPFNC